MSDADERHERPGGRWLPVAVLRPFAPAHLPDVECISRMAELMRQVRVERRGRWPITSARTSTPGPPCAASCFVIAAAAVCIAAAALAKLKHAFAS